MSLRSSELHPADAAMIEAIMEAELDVRFGDKLGSDEELRRVAHKFLERLLPLRYDAMIDIYQMVESKKFEHEVTLTKI